jgi:Protein of unknown function (DUF2635)
MSSSTSSTSMQIAVWPKPGTVVRDEHTHKPLRPGQTVRRTRYVLRRLRDGSLLPEAPQAPPPPTPTACAAPPKSPKET